MEFLKRKHFSLWIITIILGTLCRCGHGLQGVPTWLCLGIKSPFIEFRNEIEVLSNTTVNLNITKDEYTLMHEKGLQNLGSFIRPVDLRNASTGYVKTSATKKIHYSPSTERKRGTTTTESPIAEEMNRKEIELIEDEKPTVGFPGINNEDQKFIVPMALKNPANEPKKDGFSTNIDDLKNHILMLQNMTENDKSFQSKFVVFPHLQSTTTATTKTTTTTTTRTTKIPTTSTSTRRSYIDHSKSIKFDEIHEKYSDDHDDHGQNKERITIVPQVLLLNDQTPPDDDLSDRSKNGNRRDRLGYQKRRNYNRRTSTPSPKPKTIATTTPSTTTTTTTTSKPTPNTIYYGSFTTSLKPRRNPKRQRSGGGGGGDRRNKNRRQENCKNLDTPRCQRQRRRQLARLAMSSTPNPMYMSRGQGSYSSDSLRYRDDDLKLSRSIRSHNRRNAGSKYEDSSGPRDFIIPVGNGINNNQSGPYKESINLDPELCYKVGGMTYSQQKLCYLHTSIMPAISRGARSAIQECKHQFKNRRWNCSTNEDETVFGPTSSIGSPEMAFIHALAAATTTSFIARACRDGQLASCGCSRSSRPKQLADDWTWGGCGDDLEFAYKFSQNFIDIREKERKRGPRGLVSVPPKHSMDEKSSDLPLVPTIAANATASNNDSSSANTTSSGTASYNYEENPNVFKPEDLLELQEKITKEILNSKLQEREMMELQEKINREILNSKVFNLEHHAAAYGGRKPPHQRAGIGPSSGLNRMKSGASAKARSMMNLHNNEAGRRAVIKKTRITCKCHGVSGSCSLITCWQQLSSIRDIGDYLREKYDEATQVRLNKRGRLQVKDSRYKVPTVHDLVYLDESPDWCRNNRALQWPGTHGRRCNKTSSGLDGCGILCCGRGYNTKKIVLRERCNCKFHWCCHVKCETCVKVSEEHTCK